jgi:hypothetical protein
VPPQDATDVFYQLHEASLTFRQPASDCYRGFGQRRCHQSLPHTTDNTLITLEEASDNELKAATAASREARHDARRYSGIQSSPGHPELDTSTQ